MAGLQQCQATARVHLLPQFLSPTGILEGVHQQLSAQLTKHAEGLGGALMAYSNVRAVSAVAKIMYELPNINFDVQFDALLFTPAEGMRLVGVVNNIGDDHIGLLICGVFNVSVPISEIRNDFIRSGHQWKGAGEQCVMVGSFVLIEITRIHIAYGRYVLEGSMNSDELGPLDFPPFPTHSDE